MVEDNELTFIYLTTGQITKFWDIRNPKPLAREIFSFQRPERLRDWLKTEVTLRRGFQLFPPLVTDGFGNCQVNAITNLEKSLGNDHPRALIQVATEIGKTFTAISFVYRLLKFVKAQTNPVPGGYPQSWNTG